MKIHRKIIIAVAMGMLAIVAITIVSLRITSGAFIHTLKGMENISADSRSIWNIERKLSDMSFAVHNFVQSGGDPAYRISYEALHKEVQDAIDQIPPTQMTRMEQSLVSSMSADLAGIERLSREILSRSSYQNRSIPLDQLNRLDATIKSIRSAVEQYQAQNSYAMSKVTDELHMNKVRIRILFLITLITSIGFLFIFVVYIHRKVSIPLNDLWKGTEEIIRGNLDYHMQMHGEGDIALLAERFNDMTQKLNHSYAELEQKLFDRTRELAALDSVALTLSKAGTLKDVLDKSLNKIIGSLGGIQPRGGVFLCEPGDILRLVAHKGLSPEFVRREAVIRVGECLCGMVAQTGELLYTENSCDDKRHRRMPEEEGHSHIIIPIKSRGIVLGVIFLYPQVNFKLKQSDIQMLETIGAQLGLSVENFRFYAEVKESSEKYWDLFENSREILLTMDPEGRLTSVNKEAEKISGYSKIELSSMTIFDFLTSEGVERAGKMLAGEGEAADGFHLTEFEVVRRDGSRIFAEVSARKIVHDRNPVGFQVSARDITEQKNLRVLLVKAERLGAIGQVGVAVRHEINNPLTTVIGNVELLIERYEYKDKELTARLEIVLHNALRIAEIVKHLQNIKQEKVVDYLKGVKMTDLK